MKPTATLFHPGFLLAVFVFVLEALMFTVWRGTLGAHRSAAVFFACALLLGAAGIRSSFIPAVPLLRSRSTRRWGLIVTGILAIISWGLITPILHQHPVLVAESDIIPLTQTLARRLLRGEFPYRVISDWGYDLFPNYLPLQWMPYLLAEWLHLDYRVLALLVFLAGSFVFYGFVSRRSTGETATCLLMVLYYLPLLLLVFDGGLVLRRTLEPLIASYYVFVCLALFTRSFWWIALAFTACLLSRYAIVFFVPFFFFVLWMQGQKKRVLLIAGICAAGLLLVYVLPFLSQDGAIFLNGYRYYTQGALAEWKGQYWQAPGEKPIQLFRGLGFAGWCYEHLGGSLEARLHRFQRLHLLLSLGTVFLLSGLYHRFRSRVDAPTFALGALKIYLAVFYQFIQVPYDYLFLTLVMVSVPLLWRIATRAPQSSFQV